MINMKKIYFQKVKEDIKQVLALASDRVYALGLSGHLYKYLPNQMNMERWVAEKLTGPKNGSGLHALYGSKKGPIYVDYLNFIYTVDYPSTGQFTHVFATKKSKNPSAVTHEPHFFSARKGNLYYIVEGTQSYGPPVASIHNGKILGLSGSDDGTLCGIVNNTKTGINSVVRFDTFAWDKTPPGYSTMLKASGAHDWGHVSVDHFDNILLVDGDNTLRRYLGEGRVSTLATGVMTWIEPDTQGKTVVPGYWEQSDLTGEILSISHYDNEIWIVVDSGGSSDLYKSQDFVPHFKN